MGATGKSLGPLFGTEAGMLGGCSRRVAVGGAAAVLALATIAGCTGAGAPRTPPAVDAVGARTLANAGLDLFEAGEYALAGERFQAAARRARAAGEPQLERAAVAAECVSWLEARRLRSLALCAEQLEGLVRRDAGGDPGLNTLIALGAIAGGRPLPPLALPQAVRPVIRAAAVESAR